MLPYSIQSQKTIAVETIESHPMDAVAQIERRHEMRHNHYDEENVSRCRRCSAYVSPEKESVGVLRYDCGRCDMTVFEPVKTSLRSLKQAEQQAD